MSPNGFGISEVSEGILERSGRIPRAHFAYSVLSDVATEAEGEGATKRTGIISEAVIWKSERPKPCP